MIRVNVLGQLILPPDNLHFGRKFVNQKLHRKLTSAQRARAFALVSGSIQGLQMAYRPLNAQPALQMNRACSVSG